MRSDVPPGVAAPTVVERSPRSGPIDWLDLSEEEQASDVEDPGPDSQEGGETFSIPDQTVPVAAPTKTGSAPESASPGRDTSDFLRPGTRIRHYELVGEIGRGGMGRVFLARDLKLARRVAMKFVAVRSPALIQRLLAEARATASVGHENVVIIHDVDTIDGLPYIVLEHLEGRSLKDMLDKPVSPIKTLELIVPILNGLGALHARGIIHRDLKPSNIIAGSTGVVKILDLGIAKLLANDEDHARAMSQGTMELSVASSDASGPVLAAETVGTAAYMAPEQFLGMADVATDIWAVGVILHRMLSGTHPLTEVPQASRVEFVKDLSQRMPSLSVRAPNVPIELARIVDRCLEKRWVDRWPSAKALREALESFLPLRSGRKLAVGECPYPGLQPFEETDSDRFFGRSREIRQIVMRLGKHPIVCVAGPSGVGKSSFLRAGVVPSLKASGDPWQVMTMRPGRLPVSTLCSQLRSRFPSLPENLAERAMEEPGLPGALLRKEARDSGIQLLCFVDQFEELYTLVTDPKERATFTQALAGMADDPGSPVRVIVSMRSDFLDRLTENNAFADQVLRGLLLLAPPNRGALREALTQPLMRVGFRFEDEAMIEAMLDALGPTAEALPLLQFAAARLWDARDEAECVLTRRAFEEMGGIGGALASHADEVIARLSPAQQRLARILLLRLVTPDRTREAVEVADLEDASEDPEALRSLVDELVRARLLTISQSGVDTEPTRSDGAARGGKDAGAEDPRRRRATVELVHESLISGWPTLRRWLDENRADVAFLAQLRTISKQWDASGRPQGMLWRGETVDQVRQWFKRSPETLAEREHSYLQAVLMLADRAARVRRALVASTMLVLAILVGAAGLALIWIREAEQHAAHQAEVARLEAERARAAELQVSEQLHLLQKKESERQTALEKEKQERERAERESERAKTAGERARAASEKAQTAAEVAEAARKRLGAMLEKEKERARSLENERKKLTTHLK